MKSIVMTGGHHSSALPVIVELQKRHPQIEIHWFGHKYTLAGSRNPTLEYREITSLGLPFYDLKAGKFYRTYDPIRLAKIPWGFLQSLYLLFRIRPEIILSFGGYLGVPVVLAGKILGIPTVTHEQTVISGYANRLIAKFADKILYAWPQSQEFLPQERSILVGLPLRESIFQVTSDKFKLTSGLPTIYITAGKTGSHLINKAVSKDLNVLLQKYNVIHQTGDHSQYRDHEKLSHIYSGIKDSVKGSYYPEKFIFKDNIGEAFAKADLVVSRAGAHICYELLALQKPALLIPIPWVSHNEQELNALKVKEAGLAEVVSQEELQEGSISAMIDNFIANLEDYRMRKEMPLVENSVQMIVDETEKASKS